IAANGTAAWYLADHLGSIRDITDNNSGTVIDHIDYDAWGKVTNETNVSNGDRYKYTGREFDAEIGWNYNRARPVDTANGLFPVEDPDDFGAGDTNLHRYGGNSPTNATDPTGLAEFFYNKHERHGGEFISLPNATFAFNGGTGTVRVHKNV